MKTTVNPNALIYAFTTGLLGFGLVCLLVARLGVDVFGSLFMGTLSGFIIGIFVYREQGLLQRIKTLRASGLEKAEVLGDRMEMLYEESLACLVRFDASSLVILEASPGLLRALDMSSERLLDGQRLDEVLQVPAADLENIVAQLRDPGLVDDHLIEARTNDGRSVRFALSGSYDGAEYSVEAALLPLTFEEGDAERLKQGMEDLERFQKGIVRREDRVLELKGEVNQLRAKSGLSPKYSVDSETDDRDLDKFAQQIGKEGTDV